MVQDKTVSKIVYRISDAEKMIHRFSPFGYELLSDEFSDFMERKRVGIPKDADLEISVESEGCQLSEVEKTAIERAFRGHYRLQLSEAENTLKKAKIKIIWFILSMIASSILLLAVEAKTAEWIVQFAYLPIWFFGYRILIYCILDLPCIWAEICWRKQLLHAKLMLGETEFLCSMDEPAWNKKSGESFVQKYFMEGNTVLLECIVQDPEELFCEGSTKGEELISGEMAAYLEQAVPFLEKNHAISLSIDGAILREGDLERIRNGIGNHFSLRIREVDEQLGDNKRKILFFAAGLFMISFILYAVGEKLDVRYHEIVLIILWFFADYLSEFILLIPQSLYKQRQRWIRMKEMEIKQKK